MRTSWCFSPWHEVGRWWTCVEETNTVQHHLPTTQSPPSRTFLPPAICEAPPHMCLLSWPPAALVSFPSKCFLADVCYDGQDQPLLTPKAMEGYGSHNPQSHKYALSHGRIALQLWLRLRAMGWESSCCDLHSCAAISVPLCGVEPLAEPVPSFIWIRSQSVQSLSISFF